jgi:hypothetical protein
MSQSIFLLKAISEGKTLWAKTFTQRSHKSDSLKSQHHPLQVPLPHATHHIENL